MSSMDGGHIDDCISIFERMLDHCPPNIGTINAMLKLYGRNDMFLEVKELFEKVKGGYRAFVGDGDTPLIPDVYTYGAVLQASAYAYQWEYFEYAYKDMCFSGFQLDQEKHAALLVEASKASKVKQLNFFSEFQCQHSLYNILFPCAVAFIGACL